MIIVASPSISCERFFKWFSVPLSYVISVELMDAHQLPRMKICQRIACFRFPFISYQANLTGNCSSSGPIDIVSVDRDQNLYLKNKSAVYIESGVKLV